jgi:hypothetical protein
MAKHREIGGHVIPRSGEIWRAPAPRVHGGYRYVRVRRVHAPIGEVPSVTLREVTSDGEGKTGKSWSGIPRALDFTHVLTCDERGRWTMAAPYEPAP